MLSLFSPHPRRMMRLAITAVLAITAFSQAHSTPISTGSPGSGDINNAGSSPGYTQSWIGSYGDVNTGTGNKVTTVPIVSWTGRGGLPVSLSLYKNRKARTAAQPDRNGLLATT